MAPRLMRKIKMVKSMKAAPSLAGSAISNSKDSLQIAMLPGMSMAHKLRL